MSTTRSFLTRYAPFLGATLAFALLVGGTQLYASWTAAPASPPNNNVDAPLNVGSDDQVKSGRLTSLSGVRGNGIALGFCPFGSCSYPYETINLVDGQNLRINYDSREEFAFFNDGNFQAGKFTDGDNPSFLVDPTGWTQLNGLAVIGESWVPYPDDADDIASKQYVDNMMGGSQVHQLGGYIDYTGMGYISGNIWNYDAAFITCRYSTGGARYYFKLIDRSEFVGTHTGCDADTIAFTGAGNSFWYVETDSGNAMVSVTGINF